MKMKNSVRAWLLTALVAMVFAACAPAAQDQEWEKKAEALVQRLAAFVPEPVAGLANHRPWESAGEEKGTWSSYACSETGCVGLFAPLHASRVWYFEDAALAGQLEAVRNQGEAVLEHSKQAVGEETFREAMGKYEAAIAELTAKYSAQIEKLADRLNDANLTDNQRNQLIAQLQDVQKKQAQEQQALVAKAPVVPGVNEAERLDKQTAELKERVRSLELALNGNVTREWCSGEISGPVRSGTLKGRPLYRYVGTGIDAQHVCLAVYLGPEGFKNPPQIKAGELRAEFKTILVTAKIVSTPQSVKADEAVLRQVLEGLDYDALAKLLQP